MPTLLRDFYSGFYIKHGNLQTFIDFLLWVQGMKGDTKRPVLIVFQIFGFVCSFSFLCACFAMHMPRPALVIIKSTSL